MKRKLIILISILTITVLSVTLLFSYAYISASRNYTNVAIVNTKLPSGSYTFNTSNSGTISYTFNSNKMLASASSTTAIASNSAVINISLKSPDTNTVVICTYDLVWEWTSKDQYVASDVTLPYSSYNYEYSVKGSSSTSGNPSSLPSVGASLTETDLSKFTWNDTKGTIGNSAVVVKGASIASQSTTATVTSWTLTSSMYNIPEPQPNLMDKTFTAKIKVANVRCNTNSALPSGYTQKNYLQSSGTQYINTKYQINSTNNIEFELLYHNLDTSGDRIFIGSAYDVSNRFHFGASIPGYGSTYYLTAPYINNPVYYTLKNKVFSYEGNNFDFTSDSYTASTGVNIGLFARIQTNNYITTYSSGRLYNAKIWNNGNLVRSYVPAIRNSDSVKGLYDTASSGKNLFDDSYIKDNSTLSGDYYKVVPATMHSLYGNGFPFNIAFKENTSYTLSATCLIESSGIGAVFTIRYTDGDTAYLNCATTSATRVSVTSSKYKTISKIGLSYYSNIITYIKDVQLEEGTVATNYEPFPFYTNYGNGTFTTG